MRVFCHNFHKPTVSNSGVVKLKLLSILGLEMSGVVRMAGVNVKVMCFKNKTC